MFTEAKFLRFFCSKCFISNHELSYLTRSKNFTCIFMQVPSSNLFPRLFINTHEDFAMCCVISASKSIALNLLRSIKVGSFWAPRMFRFKCNEVQTAGDCIDLIFSVD